MASIFYDSEDFCSSAVEVLLSRRTGFRSGIMSPDRGSRGRPTTRTTWQLFFLLRTVGADLPVHCLRSQIIGDWVFQLQRTGKHRSSCGHLHPDAEKSEPGLDFLRGQSSKAVNIEPAEPEKLQLKFSAPNTVVLGGHDEKKGQWTMIYDEGFEVRFGPQTFFAFSRFLPPKEGEDLHNSTSVCGETMVGWFHDEKRGEWGCYRGIKQAQQGASEKNVGPVVVSLLSYSSQKFSMGSKLTSNSGRSDRTVTAAWLKGKAAQLNARHAGLWQAKAYVDRYAGLSYEAFNRRGGIHGKQLGGGIPVAEAKRQLPNNKNSLHAKKFLQKLNLLQLISFRKSVVSQCAAADAARLRSFVNKMGDKTTLRGLVTVR